MGEARVGEGARGGGKGAGVGIVKLGGGVSVAGIVLAPPGEDGAILEERGGVKKSRGGHAAGGGEGGGRIAYGDGEIFRGGLRAVIGNFHGDGE